MNTAKQAPTGSRAPDEHGYIAVVVRQKVRKNPQPPAQNIALFMIGEGQKFRAALCD